MLAPPAAPMSTHAARCIDNPRPDRQKARPMRPAQIIAIGGANFTTGATPLLENYLLAQTRVPMPAVGFVPTASGDHDAYIGGFYETFAPLACRPSVLRLFRRTVDLRAWLLAQDLVFVGGGNTKSMLAVWRDWNLPALLTQAWRAGVVLAGTSAGAICWFEHGTTDAFGGALSALPCLGLLPGTCCPHYDAEPERRPHLHRLLSAGEVPAGYAIDDAAALHFIGASLHVAVAANATARAFTVAAPAGRIVETALPVRRLPFTDPETMA